MAGDLIVLQQSFKEENEWLARRILDVAKIVKEAKIPVASVGVAIAFGNGAVATMHEGANNLDLLKAINVLRIRVEREIE